MRKILSFNQSTSEALLHRSKASEVSESGMTMVELLVIMVIIAILATLGSRIYSGVTETARLTATIDEMKNMVGLVAKLESRLGGQVGGAWSSTPTFPVTGTMKALKASQTFIAPPSDNKFSSSAIKYPYFYEITPTIKVYTTIPMSDISPPGFISTAIISGSTSTTLEVYPRPKLTKNISHRRKWVGNFYYNQTYEQLKTKQQATPTKSLPNHSIGKYVPD